MQGRLGLVADREADEHQREQQGELALRVDDEVGRDDEDGDRQGVEAAPGQRGHGGAGHEDVPGRVRDQGAEQGLGDRHRHERQGDVDVGQGRTQLHEHDRRRSACPSHRSRDGVSCGRPFLGNAARKPLGSRPRGTGAPLTRRCRTRPAGHATREAHRHVRLPRESGGAGSSWMSWIERVSRPGGRRGGAGWSRPGPGRRAGVGGGAGSWWVRSAMCWRAMSSTSVMVFMAVLLRVGGGRGDPAGVRAG